MKRSWLNWRKRGDGYLPPLPNAGSPHTTATTKLIDIGYSNLRIAERWDWARYERLCSVMKVTHYEMASLVCIPHEWIVKFHDRNMIPYSVSGGGRASALLLTIIEARVLKTLVPDVISNPFPNLSSILKQRESPDLFSEPEGDAAPDYQGEAARLMSDAGL